MTDQNSENPYHVPMADTVEGIPHASRVPQGDATGGLIPYKNPHALIAYYCAISSLIPCLGIVTGMVALVLGIIGLKKRKLTPEIKGSAHAWIGIILGGLMFLVWTVGVVLLFVGLANQ